MSTYQTTKSSVQVKTGKRMTKAKKSRHKNNEIVTKHEEQELIFMNKMSSDGNRPSLSERYPFAFREQRFDRYDPYYLMDDCKNRVDDSTSDTVACSMCLITRGTPSSCGHFVCVKCKNTTLHIACFCGTPYYGKETDPMRLMMWMVRACIKNDCASVKAILQNKYLTEHDLNKKVKLPDDCVLIEKVSQYRFPYVRDVRHSLCHILTFVCAKWPQRSELIKILISDKRVRTDQTLMKKRPIDFLVDACCYHFGPYAPFTSSQQRAEDKYVSLLEFWKAYNDGTEIYNKSRDILQSVNMV